MQATAIPNTGLQQSGGNLTREILPSILLIMQPYDLPLFIAIALLVSLPLGLYGLFIQTKLLYTRLDKYDKQEFFKKVCKGSLLTSFFTLMLAISGYMVLWEIEKLQEVSIFVYIFGLGYGFVTSFLPPFLFRFVYKKLEEKGLIDPNWSIWKKWQG